MLLDMQNCIQPLVQSRRGVAVQGNERCGTSDPSLAGGHACLPGRQSAGGRGTSDKTYQMCFYGPSALLKNKFGLSLMQRATRATFDTDAFAGHTGRAGRRLTTKPLETNYMPFLGMFVAALGRTGTVRHISEIKGVLTRTKRYQQTA
jgi:hypothetical protein